MEDQTQQFLQAEANRAAEELGVKTDDAPQTEAPAQVEPTTPVQDSPQQESVPPTQAENPPTTIPAVEAQAPVVSETEDEDDSVYPTFAPVAPNQFQQPPQQYTPAQEQPTVPSQPTAGVPPTQPSPQLSSLDPSQFTDQYGNVDMARFTAAMRARDENLVNQVTQNLTQRLGGDFSKMAEAMVAQATAQARQEADQRITAVENEKRAWDRTFAKYPQIRENKELRDQIHKMRLGEVAVTGKPVSPVKMADRYFSQIRQAREDGVRQAVETTKVQATAHLETANNTASEKGLKTQQDWSRIADRDRKTATASREALLKQMLADGKL